MFKVFGRSWNILKSTVHVLARDKELLVFPVVSGFFCMLAFVGFVIPIALLQTATNTSADSPVLLIPIFIYYFVAYFITIFFNAALVGAANIRLRGGDPGVMDGLRIAFENIFSIIVWALIAATVGTILRALADKSRNNIFAGVIVGLIGGAWSIITFFVIPVLVIEKKNPLEAMGRSGSIVKQSFGEMMISQMGFGLITLIVVIAGALLIGAITFVGIQIAGVYALAIGVAAFLLFLVAVSILTSALNAILVTALYNYAVTGKVPNEPGFSELFATVKKT